MPSALPLGDPAPVDGRLPSDLPVDPEAPLGAYLHIPFCRVRCGYCDFNTYTGSELRGARREDYAGDLLAEVALSHRVLTDAGAARPLSTVFFGGGTPTLLPVADLGAMLGGVSAAFGLAPGAEVTVEANPDTVTEAVAESLAGAGVTRLSVGMQSAMPHVLSVLDRTHRPENVDRAIAAAKAVGLATSVDLIYGAPGESLEDWTASLEQAVRLQPDHISAYALIIEDGTALARRIARGELSAPDDDLQADMYERADEFLGRAGYSWYEVSNWSRGNDSRSRHNLAYWQGGDWWGYGPGAHSHIAGLRWWNVKHPAAYAQRLAGGESPAAGRERPDARAHLLEQVLLRGRTRDGLDLDILPTEARARVAGLIADGLVDAREALAGRVVPTLRGRLMADAIVRILTD